MKFIGTESLSMIRHLAERYRRIQIDSAIIGASNVTYEAMQQ
jgi:hypothetical protein